MKEALKSLVVLVVMSIPAHSAPIEARVACNLGALTKTERKRDSKLAKVLVGALVERRELANGYSFRFTADSIQPLTEWTSIIVKCCQPITYQLDIGPQPGGAVWLHLTGAEGVKEFIEGEFRALVEKVPAK